MTQQAAEQLEDRVAEFFRVLDTLDVERLTALCAEDVHRVDEISRAWRRGRDAFRAHFEGLEDMIEDLHSRIDDVVIRAWGDTGVVTCVIDQTYMMGEEEQRLTAAPTTLVFRRENGEWRLVLFHSVPVR